MKKKKIKKKILSAVLSLTMLAGVLPGNFTLAKDEKEFRLDNGYITAVVSPDNGGFMIRTAEGDKISKGDDNKDLLYHDELDDTSFTSFQITRGGETKEYIFGGEYEGSSDVKVTEGSNELTAVWSVDNIEFTQTMKLENAGSNEHGMVYVSYRAKNQGEPADIKARVLLDTALGEQDYAYYRIGSDTVERETTFDSNGYDKTFYAYNDPYAPEITAYIVNASIDDAECKPYQMQVAHWANLASTVFTYETDSDMTFTNPNNSKHLTADSAAALYYDFGNVAQNADNTIAFNYGVFSHENIEAGTQVTFDVTAPDALELTEDQTAYKDEGLFTVVSNVKNISDKKYDKVRVVVQATDGITPIDMAGNEVNATYDDPYTYEWIEFVPSQTQEVTWKFRATPQAEGVYGKVSFKIYDVSDEATLNTGQILAENLLGEGRTYILMPGSVTKIPAIKFTAATPDTLYIKGERTLNITGDNFSMLTNKGEYKMMVSRVDGMEWNGITEFEIPSDNFSIDEIKNTITVKMDETMPELAEGRYRITFRYTAADKKDLTAAALQFMVKDDVRYKNDMYGLLAVVKDASDEEDITYSVQKFADEKAYSEYLEQGADRDDVLLEFRGKFELESENGVNTYTALSRSGEDNVITLNSCMDIEKGTVVVTEEDGSVVVDFDASIYTTGSRTSVFKGVCGLTELERGEDYALIEYDEQGERSDEDDDDEDEDGPETITLLWPSVGQAAQNLLGMLFDMRYAELGVMKNEEDESVETRVLSFGASLDLSFTIPDSSTLYEKKPDDLATALGKIAKLPGYSADDLRKVEKEIPHDSNTKPKAETDKKNQENGNNNNNNNNSNNNTDEDDDDDLEFSGSVEINDILFGGKYLGVNFAVEIGVPSLVDGMPDMEAVLEINTIGDWALSVDGECEFASFELEAGISIKSKNNIPVPDSLHFYMGGFVPGINVDGFGILWLQGAGGGIENLYDTVFLKEAVPPLKLIIEAQFSLMQIITARAKLELSLQGIGVELTEGKIADSLEVLEHARLQFLWYPDFYFMSSAYLNVADVIKGGGYIVVENDGFFEFFVTASVGIPDAVPLVGGIELASVGLGVNTQKIWGKVHVLFLDFGIVYYWGGGFEWGGGAGAEPTYPDLLGSVGGVGNDIPVYYDEDTGRTLYARVGTNLTKQETQAVSEDRFISSDLYTADSGSGVPSYAENLLQTNLEGSRYVLTLAPKQKNELLTVEWTADSLEAAREQAAAFSIKDNSLEGGSYKLTYLDHEKDTEAQNANANVTYDNETGRATMCVSFTDEKDFNKQWNLEFGNLKDVQVTLYDVEDMPELSGTDTKLELDETDSSKAELTLKGNKLNKFTNVSVFAKKKETASLAQYMATGRSVQSLMSQPQLLLTAVNKTESETETQQGTLLYYEEKAEGYADGDVLEFELPQTLESGEYDIQVVAKDSDEKYNSSADLTMEYENKNAPGVTGGISDVKNAGDYQLKCTVNRPAEGTFDGYAVCVYDENGDEVSGLGEVLFNADGSRVTYDDEGKIRTVTDKPESAELTVGGQYSYTDTETGESRLSGLEAGKSYQLGIRTWKLTDAGLCIQSAEKRTALVAVKESSVTRITFTADKKPVTVADSRTTVSGEAVTFETKMYASDSLTVTASADSEVTGKWKLDNGDAEGTFDRATKKIEIPLKDVADGKHLLTIQGTNENGDSFREVYSFGVDTLAPRMMLSAPTGGTVYTDGTLTIAGVTDEDAKLTVVDETTGKKLMDAQSVTTDEEGRFSTSVTMDDSVAFHTLTITAADALGNKVQKQVGVVSGRLGQIESLALYADGRDVTNRQLAVDKTYDLQLMAKVSDGSVIEINNESVVDWQETVMEGTAVLTATGDSVSLTVSEDSCGMVTARYLVNDEGAYTASAAFTADIKQDEPEESISPEESANPEESGQPQASANPEESGQPQASANPEESGQPQTSANPEESGQPQTSANPEETGQPQGAAKPDDTTVSGVLAATAAAGQTADAGEDKNTADKKTGSDETGNVTEKSDKADGARTGDNTGIVIPLCAMIASAGAAVVVTVRRRKRKHEKEA